MIVIRLFLKLAVLCAWTFVFLVLLQHGVSGFADGARDEAEWVRSLWSKPEAPPADEAIAPSAPQS